MMEVGPISIFTYLDYREFLRDQFKLLSQRDRKYSQRWFASRIGLNSPQLISMILNGTRHLAQDLVPAFSHGFALTEKEEVYFGLIVELAQTEHFEKQQDLLRRIQIEFGQGIFKDMSPKGFQILKYWYLPVLRELAPMHASASDAKSLAQMIGLSETQAEEGLKILVENGYLQKSAGRYTRSEPSLRADDFVSPLFMANFHLQMLERSFKALSLPREKRHFEALTIAMPKSQVGETISKIKALVREIDMRAEESKDREEVVQLNIQFFSHLEK